MELVPGETNADPLLQRDVLQGVAAVYTPKDFELNRIMSDVVGIVERANERA